jgi:hypothetical protein
MENPFLRQKCLLYGSKYRTRSLQDWDGQKTNYLDIDDGD